MLRVVVDTNIFVSSLLNPRGAPAQVLDAWRGRKYLLVVSPAILAEIRAVLEYAHIRQHYTLQQQDIDDLVNLLEQEAMIVYGQADVAGAVPADPDDEKFLACALDGQADLSVSGDRHLLELGDYGGVRVMDARGCLERLDAQ